MNIIDLHGNKLPVIGLDFETFYETGKGAKMTLSKMTTTSYVRSAKFRAHGASIRLPGDARAWWVSACELRDVLREYNWEKTALLCQNAAFDGLIMSHHYGHIPAYYLDTMSMSRGEWGVHVPHSLGQIGERLDLGGKLEGELAKTANIYRLPWEIEKGLIPYGNRDVDLMWDIFEKMYYDLSFPEKELHIIDLTIRAFCAPKLHVDRAMCELESEEEAAKKSRLVAISGAKTTQLMSNPQFAELLRERGVDPPMKESPTTHKQTFAFSKGDLDFQVLAFNPKVADLVRARLAVKSTIAETRAHRFIEHSTPILPVPLQYCGAHTHRWSAWDKINMQNLPSGRKDGQSDRLRRSIIAPPGWKVIVVDSSQIEARTNAWCAGEDDLLRVFRNNEDPYSETATDIYGYSVIKGINKNERQVGKTVELGAGFGMGWSKFAYTVRSGQMGPPVDISDALAHKAIDTYRQKRKAIVNMWNTLDDALPRMYAGEHFEIGPWRFEGNHVLMPNDLYIHYPDLTVDKDEFDRPYYMYKSRNGWVSIYGGKFDENLVQSTARTIVAFQALEIAKRYPNIVLLVHDEVVYLARDEEAEEAYQYGLECLRTPPSFCSDLPVDAEGGYDYCYSK